ncbi:RNA-guided endonuclease InsQ/TnpB family protein [Halorubrum kocurii]|uniref:Transposase, IS605 OrfB family protein n=1 Tax=Halorubrum kocurii JCM 14978 TaxID=1230456 RepID=M0P6V6_9EURY|nr:RNA-guided endonuclease TnpB family protein [Halorubrum kocurii]EMA64560.1 transposase, IS605 OrfB family protein [Halorubrum kocurii JCM 14978]
MEYSHRYHAYPTQEVAAELDYHIDVHRQAYNYTLYEYENVDDDDIGSAYKHHSRLPNWKDEFPVFSEVNSKALQRTVTRFYQNLTGLSEQKQNGRKVGKLNWKSPREFQSITYSQSGFELKNTSGRHATLWLSKIGDTKLRYHREIPDEAAIKEVTVKKGTTGDWFISFGLETDEADLPEKPEVEMLDTSNSIGIDLGILNYIHTSDGNTVDWLDLKDEYDRLRREQQNLSRKEHGSNNYENQRKTVAKVKRHIRRKVLDYQHKLTIWLVTEYDAVFVEDLNVAEMLQGDGNARNKQAAAWRQFITLLEYKGELYGTHVVQVDAAGTTKECATCGVETAKPIWVREHSCPSCGFECNRDANAAMNVLQRGFAELGLGWPEDTPVETALPADTHSVSAKRVIEAGSPTLNEAAPAAE